MIEDYSQFKKILIKFSISFVLLATILIIMFYNYNTYYGFLTTILSNVYKIFYEIWLFVKKVLIYSSITYPEVWMIVGIMALMLGVLRIVLMKLRIM